MDRVCSQAVAAAVVAGTMCSGGCLVGWLRGYSVWEGEEAGCLD